MLINARCASMETIYFSFYALHARRHFCDTADHQQQSKQIPVHTHGADQLATFHSRHR